MKNTVHYATVSEALEELQEQGFTIDFNLEKNRLVSKDGKFKASDFEIIEIYRYEGDTDPGDEATVYGIKSKTGLKGVLVTGYGMSTDGLSADILKKLHA